MPKIDITPEQLGRIIQSLPVEWLPQAVVLTVDEDETRIVDYRLMDYSELLDILEMHGLLPSDLFEETT